MKQVAEHLPGIYKYLKNHPHHNDLLKSQATGEDCSYTQFVYWAEQGLRKASSPGGIFSRLKKTFNSF